MHPPLVDRVLLCKAEAARRERARCRSDAATEVVLQQIVVRLPRAGSREKLLREFLAVLCRHLPDHEIALERIEPAPCAMCIGRPFGELLEALFLARSEVTQAVVGTW